MTQFQPLDPDFEQKVRDSFFRQPFMIFIGSRMDKLLPGVCEISVPRREELTQQHGYFHAGVTGTLADDACGYAAFSLSAPNSSVLTVEYKLNLLSPAKGERLVARAEVLKSGRTLKICKADVFACTGGQETLCATALATIMILENRADQ